MQHERLLGLKRSGTYKYDSKSLSIPGTEYRFVINDTRKLDVIYRNSIISRGREEVFFGVLDVLTIPKVRILEEQHRNQEQ